MKPKLLMAIIFLAAMAFIPLLCVKPRNSEGAAKHKDTDLCAAVCSVCRDDYCDEAVAAACCIIRTNSRCGKQEKADYDSDTELYKRVKRIFDSSKELLYQNNALLSVPYAPCSNGSTFPSGKQASVASPWDCLSPRYSAQNQCTGVSLDGVDYLCKNGLTQKEAVKWYLPNAEIRG